MEYAENIINSHKTIREALELFNRLGKYLTLFAIDTNERLLGTITDGDIRRALVANFTLDSRLEEVCFKQFRFLEKGIYSPETIKILREKKLGLVPVLDKNGRIDQIINFELQKTALPLDVLIMAGGEGKRLRPLTENLPKPMLKVGDKPIIEHNIDRLKAHGVQNIQISINYLGHKISDYFGNGKSKGLKISYVTESKPLGTLGSITLANEFQSDYVLVMNSDLLTNIDFEDFYNECLSKNSMMSIASIPYHVNVPYAILETENNRILSFKEKPTYTYYSNAGIYLIKRQALDLIPIDTFFNATDLMTLLIENGESVTDFPILGYWLDIGQHDEYQKAQHDIKHIHL